jgi:hypothetical protein
MDLVTSLLLMAFLDTTRGQEEDRTTPLQMAERN